MKNDFGHFSEELVELAHEMWEFRTCQRSDGSYYGTGGQCRKGTETEKPEKGEKKGKSGGFAMDKSSLDGEAVARKLGSINMNDPEMKEFKQAYDSFASKTEKARENNLKEEQGKVVGATDGKDPLSKKLSEAEKLERKSDKEMDKNDPNWDKVDQYDDKARKLKQEVDEGLAKSNPEYKKALQEQKSALKAYEAATKDTPGDDANLKTPEYKTLNQKAEKRAELRDQILESRGRSKGIISSEFETGQGVQIHYGKGNAQKFVNDADKVAEKAIAAMQKKYPDFMPDQSPKQVMAQLGIGEGGGRAQSNEMFYQNNAVSSVIADGAMNNAFGVDGNRSGKTFKDVTGDIAFEYLD